jgi:xanthosine utilization system XapX-like protein
MTNQEPKSDERGQQDAFEPQHDAEHSESASGTLLALASEINQQLAWPYALSLLVALGFAAIGAAIVSTLTVPWVAVPLAAGIGFLGGLAVVRGVLLVPWVRRILDTAAARAAAAHTTLDALVALADDTPSLSLLSSAHRRWERP